VTRTKYHRLPGHHSSSLLRSSLWSSDDHLLLVKSNGYVERYYRYYYGDIQGFTVEPTLRGRHIALATGLPLSLFTGGSGLAIARLIDVDWLFLTIPLSLPLLILLVINWIKGPTCTTIIYTAVSDVVLSPLGRRRVAFRTLNVLSQFITAVQGPLDPSQLGFFIDRDASATIVRKVSAKQEVVVRNNSSPSNGEGQIQNVWSSRRTLNLWLIALGGTELFHALAALSLVVFGGGAIRQSALCIMVVLALIVASVGLTRGGPPMKWLGTMALVHTALVGVGCLVAFYVGIFQRTFRNPNAPPTVDVTKILDPSLPAVVPVLWLSSLGAFGLLVGCLLVFLHTERMR
jgi:FtsH-binding integral membrane protein